MFSRSAGGLNTGGTPDLMLYNPSDNSTSLLLKGTVGGRGEYNAVVSPDGSQIIFNTYRFSGWKLGIADFTDEEITNVKRFTSRSNYEYNAKHSSDGKRVAYQEYNWGTSETDLFIADYDGTNVSLFTTEKGGDRNPEWTKDDTQIVFTSGRGLSYDIYIKSVDGKTTQKLTNHPRSDFAPSVSSLDDKITFLSDRKGCVHLYMMDLDGEHLTNLTPDLNTDSSKLTGFNANGYWAYKTSWSPDGNQIVFNALINGDIELFIVNRDGTGLTQITENKDTEISPFWIK